MNVISQNTISQRWKQTPAKSDAPTARTATLDRQADHELHLGRHHQAERLARLAAGLREVAQ